MRRPVLLSRIYPRQAAIFAAALLGIAALLYVITQAPATPPPPFALADMPKTLPEIGFSDADGGRHSLAAYRGRYVLLNLWAPWCLPCVTELPALARLKSAVPDSELAVLAVDVGRDTPQQAAAFLKEHDVAGLGTYVDTDIALIRALKASVLPVTILIDRRGHEVGRAIGAVEWDSQRSVEYFQTLKNKP